MTFSFAITFQIIKYVLGQLYNENVTSVGSVGNIYSAGAFLLRLNDLDVD